MVIKMPTEIDYVYKAKFEYDEGPIKSELNLEKSSEARTIQEKLEANIMGFGKPELWNLKNFVKLRI